MRAPLYIAMCDLARLKIRKVIIQPKSWRAVVFFQHPSMLDRVAFSASVTFQLKDGPQWHTSFTIRATELVNVDKLVESVLKNQLTVILSPYFTSLFLGESPW